MKELLKLFSEYLEKDKKDKNFDYFKEILVEKFPHIIKIINQNLIINTHYVSEEFVIELIKKYKSIGFKILIVLVETETLSKEWKYIFKTNNVFYLDVFHFDTISQLQITKLINRNN